MIIMDLHRHVSFWKKLLGKKTKNFGAGCAKLFINYVFLYICVGCSCIYVWLCCCAAQRGEGKKWDRL